MTQPEDPKGSPGSGRDGIAAWSRRIAIEVRDDIAKDYAKEAVKLVLYSAAAFLIGGGAWWVTKEVRFRDSSSLPESPSFSYLAAIINEATRNNQYGVRWQDTEKPFVVYCESFVSNESDPAERLEQFAKQFPGCVSATRETIGSSNFVNISLGPDISPPVCLSSEEGDLVEQLYFCGCENDARATVIGNRLFAADPGTREAECPATGN